MGHDRSNGPSGVVLLDSLWTWLPQPLKGPLIVVAALLLATAATLLEFGLSRWLPQQSVGLLYILAVVVAAVGFGTWTGLTVAVLSFLAYNFFFIPPVFTFTIANPRELFALFVFLAVALLTGSLAGRTRAVADAARRRADALQLLNEFAARLSGSRDVASVLRSLARQAAESVHGEAVVLTSSGEDLAISASRPCAVALDTADWQSAKRAIRSQDIALATAPGWRGGRFEFHPIKAGAAAFGVIGIAPSRPQRALRSEEQSSLETILRHTSIAIERTQLEEEAVRARGETERERLRSALLSSLSHDLRTPLASIVGAVTSLRELGAAMTPETRDDLLAAIEEEAGRLSRFVTNLLQMTRLETEEIDLVGDWIDVGDVARTAVSRARQLTPAPEIDLRSPALIPAIRGDATLLDQVIFNLLENSTKFSKGRTHIIVALETEPSAVLLAITDDGGGIPPEAQPRVFEPFFRVKGGDRDVPGTGLGLAIAKRIVEGMGGTIRVESPVSQGRGTRVVLRLPAPGAQDERPSVNGEVHS